MKKTVFIISTILIVSSITIAQDNQQTLSKTAKEGALYDVQLSESGELSLTYGYKSKKEERFVNYSFDADLKLLNEDESAEPRIKVKDKPTLSYEYIYTSVGGCSSFDILSMTLNVSKISVTKTWNNKRQRYDADFTEEKISGSKDNKFKYKGYVGYFNAETGANLVLVKADDKSDEDESGFKLASITLDGKVNEISIGELVKYNLVFSSLVKRNPDMPDKYDEQNLAEYNALFIFAPSKKTTADAKDFVVLITDGAGNKISETTVTMPMPSSTIMEMQQSGNDLYFFGLTAKSKATYYKSEFMDYTNIDNPCYTDFYNYRDQQRETNISKADVTDLILMKMTGDKLAYLTLTSTDEQQSKRVVPPSVKKVPKKPFSRFNVQAFKVFENGDMVVTGQRKVIITLEGTAKWAYEEIMCYHFDKAGKLRSEYYVEPQLATAKKDKIFPVIQKFIVSADNSNVYWILYEPEGLTGYATFFDAYYGRKTIYPAYQPVVMKIDMATAKLADPELPLGKNYLVYENYPLISNPNSSTGIFLGQTRKGDSLGMTKYNFK
jgi:hypothetical protein